MKTGILTLSTEEIDGILDGLDVAIEALGEWLEEDCNSAQDRREIRARSRRFLALLRKLGAYRPDHYSVRGTSTEGARLGTGKTATPKTCDRINGSTLNGHRTNGTPTIPFVTKGYDDRPGAWKGGA